jgi:hypothetical protein
MTTHNLTQHEQPFNLLPFQKKLLDSSFKTVVVKGRRGGLTHKIALADSAFRKAILAGYSIEEAENLHKQILGLA